MSDRIFVCVVRNCPRVVAFHPAENANKIAQEPRANRQSLMSVMRSVRSQFWRRFRLEVPVARALDNAMAGKYILRYDDT